MIEKRVLVFGATGHIGGAVTRELLQRGWRVRAATRSPGSEKARALAQLGAEVVAADMDDRASLDAAFTGMRRVFSVQSWNIAGVDGEVRQGKLVAQAAQAAGVEHLIYGSAGDGAPNSGVPHFDCKLEVEASMRQLGLPFTVVRPGPFMELLTLKEFYPALAAWGAQTRVLGWDTPIPWVAVHDLGRAIALQFEQPETWIGREISLIGDVKTLGECRQLFADAGKQPRGLPLPVWLFKRMAGDEFVKMWRWMDDLADEHGREGLLQLAQQANQHFPGMLTLQSWLEKN